MQILLALSLVVVANAQPNFFRLHDHPDGAAAPPTYGIRLDRLFQDHPGANGGQTTFSFSNPEDKTSVTLRRNGLNFRIRGHVYGGEDVGTSYGYGANRYRLSYDIVSGVRTLGDGWAAKAPGNSGFIRRPNFEQLLFSKGLSNGDAFLLRRDGHRLNGHPQQALNPFVGRGWLMFNDSFPVGGGSQDFLFLAEPIPATRDRCWFETESCHIERLLPFTVGCTTFTTVHQVLNVLSQFDNPAKSLLSELVLFHLNIHAFDLFTETFHFNTFESLFNAFELELLDECAESDTSETSVSETEFTEESSSTIVVSESSSENNKKRSDSSPNNSEQNKKKIREIVVVGSRESLRVETCPRRCTCTCD